MCGIIGAVAERDIVNVLVEGLSRLEYRGYDSAGVAVLNGDQKLERVRCMGKVNVLKQEIKTQALDGNIGIAHTRWATHGKPSERNAHPHFTLERLAVVHNGIIENHNELRVLLSEAGYQFTSETDTEVIAHLVHRELKKTGDLKEAVQNSIQHLQGAYGAVLLDNNDPERIVVARSGSPLVIGIGQGENYIASDQLALLPVTRRFIYLEEGDVAEITKTSIDIFDKHGDKVARKIHQATTELDAADKGAFPHFMLKEIYDQPKALEAALEGRIRHHSIIESAFGHEANELLERADAVQILACGTSFHAGLVAKYWLESIAGIPCNVEVASEYRYRNPVLQRNTLVLTISQSGETADTLAALRYAQEHGALASMAICNVSGSSLVRESDLAFMTRAGVEIGVASTKAFTTQLAGLAMLTIAFGQVRGLSLEQQEEMERFTESLLELPKLVEKTLMLAPQIAYMAKRFRTVDNCIFLGRGDHFPIALEGALKLKEISYIHAEAYAAGELKHGPLALIDDNMPVVIVAPDDALEDKLKSNIEEIRARGGQLFIFTHAKGCYQSEQGQAVTHLPTGHSWLAPILYTIPLQLLSYYVALEKGTDIDQPRNLAKSVTVE